MGSMYSSHTEPAVYHREVHHVVVQSEVPQIWTSDLVPHLGPHLGTSDLGSDLGCQVVSSPEDLVLIPGSYGIHGVWLHGLYKEMIQ